MRTPSLDITEGGMAADGMGGVVFGRVRGLCCVVGQDKQRDAFPALATTSLVDLHGVQ